MDEQSAVALLRSVLSQDEPRDVMLGIGDDAAVLRRPRAPLTWTVDASIEGTHFRREWLSLQDIGDRAFQAAVSDLAAMGALPVAALSSLVLPPGFDAAALRRLALGQARAARALGCPVAGGNVAFGNSLEITTTALGTAKRPLRRDGAREGDEVWLIGELGLAAAGLRLLDSGLGTQRTRARELQVCIGAWSRPRALIKEGRRLAVRARAAIDVSDGAGLDAQRLADASGVRLVLELEELRRCLRSELFVAAKRLRVDALELALQGGEDYALIATGPAARRPRWARPIGRVERGRGAVLRDGSRRIPLGVGFDHFQQRRK